LEWIEENPKRKREFYEGNGSMAAREPQSAKVRFAEMKAFSLRKQLGHTNES